MTPASLMTCLRLETTAGIPAATFFTGPNVSRAKRSGFSGPGKVSSLIVSSFYWDSHSYHFDLRLLYQDIQNLFQAINKGLTPLQCCRTRQYRLPASP